MSSSVFTRVVHQGGGHVHGRRGQGPEVRRAENREFKFFRISGICPDMDSPKNLKILHLISQKPDSTGSGIYVQAMIREADARGYDNYLVAGIHSREKDRHAFIESDRSAFVNFFQADISYHIPGMSDVMPYESTRFCDLSEQDLLEYETAFSATLKQAVQAFKPHIIHSHHLWIVTSLARRLFPDLPMVTTCHGTDLRQFENCPHYRKSVLSGCLKLDRVMALSEAQKKEITRLYGLSPEKIAVVGAGFDRRLFYLDKKPHPGPVQLVYAGKLSYAKGVPWLLRALESIETPPWRLHLLGGGSGREKDHCLRLAERLGKRVKIYGPRPQQDLAEVMRGAHIFVLPSFFEGLPLVIMEAMASGCRIVTTDLPGAREILGHSDADVVQWVKTPRLRHMDQPYEEDEPEFEQNLKKAIQTQILAISGGQQADMAPFQEKIKTRTWSGVFRKVRDIYMDINSLLTSP